MLVPQAEEGGCSNKRAGERQIRQSIEQGVTESSSQGVLYLEQPLSCTHVHVREYSLRMRIQDERPFSPEEEEKLQGALGLEAKDLELVIETTTFILQQAAYHLAKPALLKTHLTNVALDEDKVCVCDQWKATKHIICVVDSHTCILSLSLSVLLMYTHTHTHTHTHTPCHTHTHTVTGICASLDIPG